MAATAATEDFVAGTAIADSHYAEMLPDEGDVTEAVVAEAVTDAVTKAMAETMAQNLTHHESESAVMDHMQVSRVTDSAAAECDINIVPHSRIAAHHSSVKRELLLEESGGDDVRAAEFEEWRKRFRSARDVVGMTVTDVVAEHERATLDAGSTAYGEPAGETFAMKGGVADIPPHRDVEVAGLAVDLTEAFPGRHGVITENINISDTIVNLDGGPTSRQATAEGELLRQAGGVNMLKVDESQGRSERFCAAQDEAADVMVVDVDPSGIVAEAEAEPTAAVDTVNVIVVDDVESAAAIALERTAIAHADADAAAITAEQTAAALSAIDAATLAVTSSGMPASSHATAAALAAAEAAETVESHAAAIANETPQQQSNMQSDMTGDMKGDDTNMMSEFDEHGERHPTHEAHLASRRLKDRERYGTPLSLVLLIHPVSSSHYPSSPPFVIGTSCTNPLGKSPNYIFNCIFNKMKRL